MVLRPGYDDFMKRIFRDWREPALPAAAAFLLESSSAKGAVDLENTIVAVPGGRVGRRLLELLVELAETRSLPLAPPQIVTAGALPELLYEVKRPFASPLVQQLAWIEALKSADRPTLEALVREPPQADDLPAWLALGQMLSHLHRELAADARNFDDVLKFAAKIEGFNEQSRWQALARLQAAYLSVLDSLELWDMQTARRFAIEHRECTTDRRIVLVGMVDMDRTQRAMLDQVAERVSALVFAPKEMADQFDEHGCLRAEQWREMRCPVNLEQIEIVDGPADQADAVLRALAAWQGKYAAEEITLGVPDESVLPYLQERLEEAGLPHRYGPGVPLSRSGPLRLLSAVADYLDEGRFTGLAALVRHPAIGPWLAGRGIRDDCLTLLDRYYVEHLPARPADVWLGEGEHAEKAQRLHRTLEELVKPLRGKPQTLDHWGGAILGLLVEVYGGQQLDRQNDEHRLVLEAAAALREAVRGFESIPQRLSPAAGGAQALRLLLRELEGAAVPPRSSQAAIELLGWLELPLDDAPALIVTGVNEGIVPSSRNADLFLPNTLRSLLGLDDNDRRYARDNYALNVLAASRQELKLIAGRRSPDGEPLSPSRLLLACDDADLAVRARAFFTPPPAARRRLILPHSPRAGRDQSEFPVPLPAPLPQPVLSLRVTEFRDYLACPYRYYLRHRLKLEALDDEAEELDAAQFGSLLHEVLCRFGQGPLADCTSAGDLRQRLGELLDEVIAEAFGEATLAAVHVQAEQVRLRLAAFADWQARWRGDGWKICHTEQDIPDGQAMLVVDGQTVYLRGRIDRIDRHEASGEHVVFDYKTGDLPRSPDKAHRRNQEWIDLQLPLYRHLVRSLAIETPLKLGYIVLPKDLSKAGEQIADWTDDELAAADRTAEEVVRGIRAEKFWPPAEAPPEFCEEFAAICHDNQFVAHQFTASQFTGAPDDEEAFS